MCINDFVFEGVKAYECNWEGCEYKSTHPGVLRTHMLNHTGETGLVFCRLGFDLTIFSALSAKKGSKASFACKAEECDYHATHADEMKKHMKSRHKG
jgi:hypothetical protein